MPADVLFRHWVTSLNASGLFHEALAEQMTYQNIERDGLVALVDEALHDETYDLGELVEQTSSLEDHEGLLEAPNAELSQYE